MKVPVEICGIGCLLGRRGKARLRTLCLASMAVMGLSAAGPWAGKAIAEEPTRSTATSNPLLITLGTNMVWAPSFEGSKRQEWGPWPIIGWRRQNDKEWLDLPTDGIDLSLIETENFRAGPVGYLRWQRDNATIAARGFERVGRGRNAIDVSLEAGGFLEYWPAQWLRTRLEIRESVLGASGLLGIVSTDLVWRPTSAWTFSAGPRLTIADGRFMESYYGVNGAQSFATGLPAYNASAGVRSYGANAFARYKMSAEWTTQAFVDWQRLTASAADSPVITKAGTPDQVMIGVGISYTFRTPW